MSEKSRHTAVAGLFYPDNPTELSTMVNGFLEAVPSERGTPPKAIIVPHAGYAYSGAVAACAYARLAPMRNKIRRVVLMGPSHRVPLRGIAAPTTTIFESPLGNIHVDREAIATIESMPQVIYHDGAHRLEHSLEVHLPFLQTLFDDFTLVPLVVGDAEPRQVAEVLEALWGDEETLIVVSSDLSHYHSYEDARKQDAQTSRHIETLDYRHIQYDDACGRNPINGFLYLAEQRGFGVQMLALCNSGDTAGSRDRVVGYGAYVLTGAPA